MAVVCLPLLIVAISLDFGGILPWSRWVVAVVSLALAILAWTAHSLVRLDQVRTPGNTQDQYGLAGDAADRTARIPALFLLAAAAYVLFQTVDLPASWVAWLSPGTGAAYTQWLTNLVPTAPDRFPISVDVDSTLGGVAILLVLSAFAMTVAWTFRTGGQITVFLSIIAVGAAAMSVYGLVRLASGDPFVWDAKIGGFGTFVNRNAAAMWLNLGLGCSLGILAIRSSVRFGHEVDDPEFEINDWFGLSSDPQAIVGIFSGLLCMIALLACGSRGGLVAAIIGFVVAMGWVRGNRGLRTYPIIALMMLICVVVMIVPFRLSITSLKRFSFFNQSGTGTISEDGRWNHWQDALVAFQNHLPLGSGAGTYGDAYRPYQDKSAGSWFEHADNLWLEWLVELGLFGAVVMVLVVVYVVKQLRLLLDSNDSIDHGLRATGWYTLSSVFVADCFNFGSLHLCNAMVVVAIFSILGYRATITQTLEDANASKELQARAGLASLHTSEVNKSPTQKFWLDWLRPSLSFVATSVAILGCFWSVSLLGTQAKVDAEIRARQLAGSPSEMTVADLQPWIDRLSALPRHQSLDAELSLLQFSLGRRLDLDDADPGSDAEAEQLFAQTETSTRRLNWSDGGKSIVGPRPLSAAPRVAYDRSVQYAQRALEFRPLAVKPRSRLIACDFHHGDVAMATKAFDELSILVHNNAAEMFKLGRYAAGSADQARLRQAWFRSMELNPSNTAAVLSETFRRKLDRKGWAFPDKPEVSRAAIQWLLQQQDPDRSLLQSGVELLSCESCDTQASKAACYQLSAEAKLVLGKVQEGFSDYVAAVNSITIDPNLRLQFCKRLKEYGYGDSAITEATKARVAIPGDPRFDQFINAMIAESEVKPPPAQ
jgi:O-antigen ligase